MIMGALLIIGRIQSDDSTTAARPAGKQFDQDNTGVDAETKLTHRCAMASAILTLQGRGTRLLPMHSVAFRLGP